jgi:hypothetical protein
MIIDLPPDDQDGGGIGFPACNRCAHRNRANPRICKAFPDGIPRSILSGGNDHTEKVGDELLLFEPAGGSEARGDTL